MKSPFLLPVCVILVSNLAASPAYAFAKKAPKVEVSLKAEAQLKRLVSWSVRATPPGSVLRVGMGEQLPLNYTITVDSPAVSNSDFKVEGTVLLRNDGNKKTCIDRVDVQ